MTTAACAPSFVSRRSLPLRTLSSGPWHWKQLLERIGRTSRLKSIFAAGCADATSGINKTDANASGPVGGRTGTTLTGSFGGGSSNQAGLRASPPVYATSRDEGREKPPGRLHNHLHRFDKPHKHHVRGQHKQTARNDTIGRGPANALGTFARSQPDK